jgi:hypothetical protein
MRRPGSAKGAARWAAAGWAAAQAGRVEARSPAESEPQRNHSARVEAGWSQRLGALTAPGWEKVPEDPS